MIDLGSRFGMEIYISSARDAPRVIRDEGITHVLTLLSRGEINDLIMPDALDPSNWLRLDMDDLIAPDQEHSPKLEQVRTILEWGRSLPDDARLLVHCYAGISRSTAAALALRVQQVGLDGLAECADWLIEARPMACPNPVISAYADQLLGANGALHGAAEAVANARLIRNHGLGWREIFNRDHMRE